MDLDTNDLILFARLIEAESFSRAAEQTGMPKVAIARRIALLEEEFGERLLVRGSRHLAITHFGERILDHARRLAEMTDAASAIPLHRPDTPHGVLRVTMPPDMVDLDLAQIFLQFSHRYPEIRIELDLSPHRLDVLAGCYDIALRVAARLPDNCTLLARKLCDFRQSLYASPAYLARYGTPEHPDDLIKHVCLPLVAGTGELIVWQLARGSDQWEGTPTGPIATKSSRLHREAAIAGIGIAGLADYLVTNYVEKGLLQRVLPDWSLPTATIWCVTPGRRLLPKHTATFIEIVRSVITKYPEHCS